ncbi:MAG: lamin tail domain-containing protein [Myxococcota bacterium]
MKRLARLALVPALAFAACDDLATDAPDRAAITTSEAPLTLAADGWEIHFSNPGTSAATRVDTLIDDRVIEAIDQATTTLDLAVYDFDHPGITSAVLRAKARGVAVRFVGFGEQASSNGYKALAAAGVPMTLRPGSNLMHDKFLIADSTTVVSGSMNFTTYGADWNDENLLFVSSPALAAVYQGEFNQMVAGTFGRKKVARAVRPVVPVQGGSIEVAFSPKEDTAGKLRSVLATAQTRVYFMIYSFTLADVAADMIALKNAGVEVVGIFDKASATNAYSVDETLAAAGIPVFMDGNENTAGFAGGRLHDKVMIVDGGTDSDPTVLTGSFNWSTGAATDNDENLMVVKGKSLVAPYIREFCRVYAVSSASTTAGAAVPTLCRPRPLVRLTEILANPDGTDRNEEFVELANLGNGPADISGWSIADAVATRHVFAAGTTLAPGKSIVVYSGPSTTGAPRLIASTNQLALNNDVETTTLRDAGGALVDQVATGLAVSGESIHRDVLPLSPFADLDYDGAPDVDRWAPSSSLGAFHLTPGLRPDGSAYDTQAAGPTADPVDPGPSGPLASVVVASAMPNPVGTDRPFEYVVIENRDVVTVDLSGWAIGDLTSPHRHVFAPGTLLAPGASLKIWDGAGTQVQPGELVASSGALSLNNDVDSALLVDASGTLVHALGWKNAADGAIVVAP